MKTSAQFRQRFAVANRVWVFDICILIRQRATVNRISLNYKFVCARPQSAWPRFAARAPPKHRCANFSSFIHSRKREVAHDIYLLAAKKTPVLIFSGKACVRGRCIGNAHDAPVQLVAYPQPLLSLDRDAFRR